MAQCRGTTRKGERCRRDAIEGSGYCSLHEPEVVEETDASPKGWEMALEGSDLRVPQTLSDNERALFEELARLREEGPQE